MRTKFEVTMLGNLGQDSKIKKFDNGKRFLEFSLCHNEKYQDKNGQMVETAKWFNCLFQLPDKPKIDKDGKEIIFLLEKGVAVQVRGTYKDSIYTDKNNLPTISRDIRVTDLDIIGKIEKRETVNQ